ncbi:MAG: hypothetical protein WDM70_00180 [Nitrosomonadales bacterium]
MINTWRDKTNGETGKQIWIPVFLSAGLLVMYIVFVLPKYSPAKPVDPFIILSILMLSPAAFLMFCISQAVDVLQEITLDADHLSGKCYFGRRLNCVASDIESLSFYPLTWKIRYDNLFDPQRSGINIVLKNGDFFRVNARTEEFSSLVDALKAFMKTSDQTRCNL